MIVQIGVTDTQGVPAPMRGLDIGLSCQWRGRGIAHVLDCVGLLRLGAIRVAVSAFLPDVRWNRAAGTGVVAEGEESSVRLFFPLAVETLRFLEEERRGRDLELLLDVQYRLLFLGAEGADGGRSPAGEVLWQTVSARWHGIPQSEWMKCLDGMKWGEWELFEVPNLRAPEDEGMRESVAHLKEAQGLLRAGNYDAAIAECRLAIESAAKHEAPGEKIDTGFRRLLVRAFPRTEEEPKRGPYNELLKALSQLAQPLGRHASAPRVPVSRPDAELILTTTVAALSAVSNALADNARSEPNVLAGPAVVGRSAE